MPRPVALSSASWSSPHSSKSSLPQPKRQSPSTSSLHHPSRSPHSCRPHEPTAHSPSSSQKTHTPSQKRSAPIRRQQPVKTKQSHHHPRTCPSSVHRGTLPLQANRSVRSRRTYHL